MKKQQMKLVLYVVTALILILLAGLLLRLDTEGVSTKDTLLGGITEVVLAGVHIPVERADTVEKRTLGLSNRTSLPDGSGMLFIFPESYTYGFWMKDMLFALDMLWLDKRGCVVAIHENISPDTYPFVFRPDEPAQFVLEMTAGFVQEHGIVVGDCATFTQN